jgi:hypothetical protein
VELALGVGGGLDGRAAGGQPHRQRRAVAGRSGLGEVVAAQGLAGRSDRIQGVGLGAVAAGGPLGPVQLDHLFGVAIQEPGQPGAVATGALNRPHPLAWLLARQLQQLLVASWGGRHGHLLDHRAGRSHDHGGGVRVRVGVDPMTSSTTSASMAMR